MTVISKLKPSMEVMTDEQIDVMQKMVSVMNDRLFISRIDYDNGFIYIGVHHNTFDSEDYLKVNVSLESVGCMMWEVANAVVKKL